MEWKPGVYNEDKSKIKIKHGSEVSRKPVTSTAERSPNKERAAEEVVTLDLYLE
jgi:hypothetical protein